uniref:Outer membrane protein beta-barrel domain-containing protein n=1 Tax=candidate division WOR-3 bacterium TaxID=2052148 RepID=A0A7C4CDK0_UNCW3
MRLAAVIALVVAALQPAAAGWLNQTNHNFEFRAGYERGFFGVLEHTIQFGRGGTQFDYVKEGNQNILFPFERLSAELHLRQRHGIVFLIQPLDVRTVASLQNPLVVDTDTFPAGTPMNLRYGFDFYRLSYQYDFWPEPERELAAGLSLQLRDASIAFASQDGRKLRVYQDVGPVPILRLRTRLPLSRVMWAGAEVDGFYAQGRVVTGSTNVESTFRGAILDASLRYGLTFRDALDGFVNVRYLGGGASGQQEKPENPGDGYTDNWLGTVSLTLGFYIR